jgi:predicted ester cyclase
MNLVEREKQVRTFVEEVWNGRNYEAACNLYAETYANSFGTGATARVEPIRHYHEAFPDLHIEIEEIIVTADTVVLRSTFRGTDTGGYAGRPPSGRRWTNGSSRSCTSTPTGSSESGSVQTDLDSSSS